ncbi:MAG: hypothetical protein M1823_002780 [Watsoniomyces obsoletus]|nr:MAG: hypothetical protein M1823_002780 [Watsoniomyces obsoletus]
MTPIFDPASGMTLETFQKAAGAATAKPASASLFPPRTSLPRPKSDATEMFDTDIEDDDPVEHDSPRASLASAGKGSISTLSSYDEAVTPISNNFAAFDFRLDTKPVEGPRGPHLFRASQDSSSAEFQYHLSMSPLTPVGMPLRSQSAFQASPATTVLPARPAYIHTQLRSASPDDMDVRSWSPHEVARWMADNGFDEAVIDNFRLNDISGAVLVDLKLDDLKELGIQSFGKRHRLWSEIHRLRGSPLSSPVDDSPESSDSQHRLQSPVDDCSPAQEASGQGPRRRRSRKNRRPTGHGETIVSPAESVSIVGIEQLIPKPHKCSKGERCAKYRRQQRQLALLAQEHHPVSPEHGGQIIITGDPGNASTAERMLRPVSDAVPSVVASSDVLGPAQQLPIALAEEHLRMMEARDPQENVKQFLTFQHLPSTSPAPEMMPMSPPLEMFPPLPHTPASPRTATVHDSLRNLPRLTIPSSQAPVGIATTTETTLWSGASPTGTVVPSRIDRFGTPCSAMDVPVTAIPFGPVSRDVSQSVPPDMRYRRASPSSAGPPRRDSWQPRFGMARVDEDVHQEAMVEVMPVRGMINSQHQRPNVGGNVGGGNLMRATSTRVSQAQVQAQQQQQQQQPSDANHAGWMKKRKTKFLRHEWQEHYFTLRGTNLAMRQDPRSSAVLEQIDVDDYAIACSSIASNKLSAAFKAMRLAKKSGGDLDGAPAFAFQLVPSTDKKNGNGNGVIHGNGNGNAGHQGGNGNGNTTTATRHHHAATGKTHHFAVKSRDDRIDWMRELMLAKALKQKGEGYQISINGNMI